MSEAIPRAIEAMSDVLIPKLRRAAPFDTANSYDDHLQDLIGRSKVKISKKGNPYALVFIKKRSSKYGKNSKNDKHVFKAVVAEYGRRGAQGVNKNGTIVKIPPLDPKPFWRTTVIEAREEMIAAGKAVIDEAIESAKNG